MNKQEFFERLRKGLSGLPKDDVNERLAFYDEMIEDRIEDGLSEEDAVSAAGNVDEIVAQIISEIPFSKIAKERIKSKRQLNAWEIILLVLGSPIWLSLVIATVAVIFSLYISLWAIIISFWSVFITLIACGLSGIVFGVVAVISINTYLGIISIAVGLVCTGLSIFTFYGCKCATNGVIVLTKKIAVWCKNRFIKKGVSL